MKKSTEELAVQIPEAEPCQSEPVGEVTHDSGGRWGLLSKELPIGAKLYARPQPCPRCAELEANADIVQFAVSRVYMEVTGGKCSKETAAPEVVIALFEDYLTERVNEEVAALEAENMRLKTECGVQAYWGIRWEKAQVTIAQQANLISRLKHEAQIHAQEARTANSTITEIYQVISGATGEPGNWNGAEPVRAYVQQQAERIKEMEDNDSAMVEQMNLDTRLLAEKAEQLAAAEKWRDELAAQNQQLRDALKSIRRYGLDTLSGRTDGPDDRGWQRAGVNELTKRARIALSLPDLASPVLNKVKAEALRDAANEFGRRWTQAAMVQKELRAMADAIERESV